MYKRFWKMARTFTGLKLQGELGRFGRTEISDIEGYRELPDGKVKNNETIHYVEIIDRIIQF